METKKNPSADVHKNRGRFFILGLAISLTIVIVAFEWTVEKIRLERPEQNPVLDELIFEVPITSVATREPIPIPPSSPIAEYIPAQELDAGNVDDVPIFVSDSITIAESYVELLPREDPSLPVNWTEEMPEPVGGYSGFYKLLQRELRYPGKARATETEGKVFVSFVVNQDGTLTDLKVVKGIGKGCDEEAIRVLMQTRWKPGRSGGRKVRVRMIQPIYFKLTDEAR